MIPSLVLLSLFHILDQSLTWLVGLAMYGSCWLPILRASVVVVLQEGDDVLEESEGKEGDEGARPGELPGGGAHSLPAQDILSYLSSACCMFLKLFDFLCAPNIAPLLGEVDIGPSAGELRGSCGRGRRGANIVL